MTKEEELTHQINAEYVLLKCVDCSEKTKPTIEQNFNQHLREYKDLTGHDFQLNAARKKVEHFYECD